MECFNLEEKNKAHRKQNKLDDLMQSDELELSELS